MHPDILLLGTRNLLTPCGEQRLIFNRANVLHSKFGLSTLAISIVSRRRLVSRQETQINDHLNVLVLPASVPGLPWAILRLLLKAWVVLASKKVEAIVISGSPLLILVPILKKIAPRTPILWDIHGAAEELIEGTGFSLRNQMIRLLIYKTQKTLERMLGNKTNAVLVVSRQMAQYVQEDLGVRHPLVVPCGVDLREWPQANDHAEIRKKIRSELSFGDELVFVYSGSLAPWQCFEETVAFFSKFYSLDPQARLLVLTAEVEKAKGALKKSDLPQDAVRVTFVAAESVPFYLMAADVALLLRKQNVTNRVASPNKFAEYLAAGLFIITGQAVGDISQMVLENNLGVLIDPDRIPGLPTEQLLHIKGRLERERGDYLLKQKRRNLAEETLSWDKIIKELEPIFLGTRIDLGRKDVS